MIFGNKVRSTVFLIAVGIVIIFIYSWRANSNSNSPVKVLLLAGQSNMVGAGNFDAISLEDLDRISQTKNSISFANMTAEIGPLKPAISPERTKKYKFENFFGSEMMIGVYLAEKTPSQEYILIKYGAGGTTLYGAWYPEWSAERTALLLSPEYKNPERLYVKHVQQIRGVLEQLEEQGRAYEISGLAWFQGESDTRDEISARSYGENLKTLIAAYRAEFNAPNLPVVMGQINSRIGTFDAGTDMVRNAMVIVSDEMETVDIIRTDMGPPWLDFPKHFDNVHYDTDGQIKLGLAFGEKLYALMNRQDDRKKDK